MALKFNNNIFFHIPKTGGNYVREVIARSGFANSEIGHVHCTPLDVDNYDKYRSFTVVRHPLNWYKSWYRYRIVTGWRKGHHIDRLCESIDFEGFVENILKYNPHGYVTEKYLSVILFVNNILKTETLTRDLKNYLKIPTNLPAINTTPKTINTSLSSGLYDRLLKAESRIIKYLKY